jgi:hypothetical protein
MVVILVGSSVDMWPLRVRVPAFTGSYLPAVISITESRTVYLYPHRCIGGCGEFWGTGSAGDGYG